MINRFVVRIPLLPTVFKEYFDMFFKVVRKNISQKINWNINSCRMRVPVPSCSRSMISGQNLKGAGRSRVWADPAPPLFFFFFFLTTKSCKFSQFGGYISLFPLNFDIRRPFFANPGSGPVNNNVISVDVLII